MAVMEMKYRTPGSRRWALWKWFDIPSTVNPKLAYLRRLRVVQTPWFGIYVHWINEPDSDRFPHDHPWRFWSLILRGGYVERVWARQGGDFVDLIWETGSVHSMKPSQAHQISYVTSNLLTLVFTGPRVREWGFWTDEGWVHWRKYDPEDLEIA